MSVDSDLQRLETRINNIFSESELKFNKLVKRIIKFKKELSHNLIVFQKKPNKKLFFSINDIVFSFETQLDIIQSLGLQLLITMRSLLSEKEYLSSQIDLSSMSVPSYLVTKDRVDTFSQVFKNAYYAQTSWLKKQQNVVEKTCHE